MARQEELNPREGWINLDSLSRGNLDSPLWENVQTCSSEPSASLLLLNQPTGPPRPPPPQAFSLVIVEFYQHIIIINDCVILNGLITLLRLLTEKR